MAVLTINDVLHYIETNPGCTSQDIADAHEIDRNLVGAKITRLRKQGYIRREPDQLLGKQRNEFYKLYPSKSTESKT